MKKKAMRVAMVGTLAATVFGITGCPRTSEAERQVQKYMSVKFDPTMKDADAKGLAKDVLTLAGQELAPETGSFFSKAFGGTTATNVIRYLDERINYVIPSDVNIDTRTRVGRSSALQQATSKIIMVAQNVGTMLYLEREAQRPAKVSFVFGGSRIPIESTRVGIIQVGNVYSEPGSIGDIERISTLVHEARHSDCTGGLSAADLALLKAGKMPINRKCGHLHAKCPAGHPFAGSYSCDGSAWGAYAVESLYTAAVALKCTNCTEAAKQEAAMVTLDDLSRVLVLKDLLAGKLGDPDMSSTGSSVARVREGLSRMRAERLASGSSKKIRAVSE